MTKSSLPRSVMRSARAEVLLSRQHLLIHLNQATHYENTTIAIKRHSHLCRGCYRALCGWLCRGGIRKHNIPAYCGGIPRAHTADAEATANLCCPATLPSRAGHREQDTFFTSIKTRKQELPTSVGNRNTSVTTSWRFSSRLPKTITWQRKWIVQPHMVGTEHGVRGRSGGERLRLET